MASVCLRLSCKVFQAIDDLIVVFGDAVEQRCAPLRRDALAVELVLDLFPIVGGAADLADLIEQTFLVNLFFLEILALLVALFFDDLAHANLMLRQFFAEIENIGAAPTGWRELHR